jgi:hypothetical protein
VSIPSATQAAWLIGTAAERLPWSGSLQMGSFPPLGGGLSVVQLVDYLCKIIVAVMINEQWFEWVSTSENKYERCNMKWDGVR